MENLEFEFNISGGECKARQKFSLVGIVASGNLEVLMEPCDLQGKCRFEIKTMARGFAASWEAVIKDFMERFKPADLLISINDHAASPSVVSLRLDQAYETLTEL